MKPRLLYVVPVFAAGAVTMLASLLLLQIVWRPWSSANTSARTDLNLREVIPADYSRTPLAWIGMPTPEASASTMPMAMSHGATSPEAGKALFFAKGCAACHGADARGGAVGPAIAGKDVAAIVKQVRTPRQRMPAFPSSAIPDGDLQQIAAYVNGLAVAASAEGHDLYFSKGCVACHGADARGSSNAPSIAGITADRIVAQVHSPQGRMPVFQKAALTRAELEQIATYLSSLPRVAQAQGGR